MKIIGTLLVLLGALALIDCGAICRSQASAAARLRVEGGGGVATAFLGMGLLLSSRPD